MLLDSALSGHWVKVSVRAQAAILKRAECAQRPLSWPLGPPFASAVASGPSLAQSCLFCPSTELAGQPPMHCMCLPHRHESCRWNQELRLQLQVLPPKS